jgi:hypothetical protein
MRTINEKVFFILALSISFAKCKSNSECEGIQNEKFIGKCVVFYHLPVSGSYVEMLIVPFCSDDNKLIEEMGDERKVKFMDGVSSSISLRDTVFVQVFRNATKLNLLNNQNLALEYRNIYACPILIDFANVENDTKSITGINRNMLNERLILSNGMQLTLKYFLSNQIKINSLRVL